MLTLATHLDPPTQFYSANFTCVLRLFIYFFPNIRFNIFSNICFFFFLVCSYFFLLCSLLFHDIFMSKKITLSSKLQLLCYLLSEENRQVFGVQNIPPYPFNSRKIFYIKKPVIDQYFFSIFWCVLRQQSSKTSSFVREFLVTVIFL